MNVLYVCADRGIPVLGNKGASVHVRSITSAMQQLGHRVTLAARRWDTGNPPPRLHRLEQLSPDLEEATSLLEELIHAEQPDVVIERHSLRSGAARAATRRCGLTLTLEVNAPLALEAKRYRGLDDPDAEKHEHDAFRTADRIQVVSSALLRYVASIKPTPPLSWIPNGADKELFRASRSPLLASLQSRVVIGFVGSMKPWHGVEQLLDAFARIHPRFPRAALVLVGAGPQDAKVAQWIERANLTGHVVWTGHVPHAQIPRLIAWFDVAVAPYLPVDDFYFDPLKVVEYLAAGKPVIYSDQGDLRALIGSGGLAYTPGSVDQLTSRLTQAVTDAALRRRLAAAAGANGKRLDWTVVAERVIEFASSARAEDATALLARTSEDGTSSTEEMAATT